MILFKDCLGPWLCWKQPRTESCFVQTHATGQRSRCPGSLLMVAFFLLLSHSSEDLTRTPNSWCFHRNIFHPVTLELLALCWHFAESKWSFTPLWMTNWRKLLLLIEEENTGMKRRRDKRRSLRGNWDAYMTGEKRWCTYYWCTNSKRIGSTSQKPVPSGYCSG